MKKAVSRKPSFGWKSYLAFFSVVMIQQTIEFFAADSAVALYYRILQAFSPSLQYLYWLDLGSVIFNLLGVIPLFLFIYRIPLFTPWVWQIFISARLIFEATGHSFEIVYFKSLINTSPDIGLKMIVAALIILLPSYWAGFWYAFGQDKIFEKQKMLFQN